MKCEQKLCSFYKAGCRKCESCGSKPHEVDEKCETCWACEFKQGKLRWGNQDNKEAEAEINNKPMEIVAK